MHFTNMLQIRNKFAQANYLYFSRICFWTCNYFLSFPSYFVTNISFRCLLVIFLATYICGYLIYEQQFAILIEDFLAYAISFIVSLLSVFCQTFFMLHYDIFRFVSCYDVVFDMVYTWNKFHHYHIKISYTSLSPMNYGNYFTLKIYSFNVWRSMLPKNVLCLIIQFFILLI